MQPASHRDCHTRMVTRLHVAQSVHTRKSSLIVGSWSCGNQVWVRASSCSRSGGNLLWRDAVDAGDGQGELVLGCDDLSVAGPRLYCR